nr:hypothetical protein Q903MT_gene1330 [Picea sitchensis]
MNNLMDKWVLQQVLSLVQLALMLLVDRLLPF